MREYVYRATINGEEIIQYPSYYKLDSKPVKRTKEEYPYSYDPYVVWENEYNKEKSNTVYSDRLFQQNSEKYNKCCGAIWGDNGQFFSNRKPEDIERFLCKYFGKEIKLTAIMEGCNSWSGYPYWIFYFEDGGCVDIKVESHEKIQRFIIDNGYTYKVEDILESYQKYWVKKHYTSYTMTHCIENLENEIKELLK